MAANCLDDPDTIEVLPIPGQLEPLPDKPLPPPIHQAKVLAPSSAGTQAWLRKFDADQDGVSQEFGKELLHLFVSKVEKMLEAQETRIVDAVRELLRSQPEARTRMGNAPRMSVANRSAGTDIRKTLTKIAHRKSIALTRQKSLGLSRKSLAQKRKSLPERESVNLRSSHKSLPERESVDLCSSLQSQEFTRASGQDAFQLGLKSNWVSDEAPEAQNSFQLCAKPVSLHEPPPSKILTNSTKDIFQVAVRSAAAAAAVPSEATAPELQESIIGRTSGASQGQETASVTFRDGVSLVQKLRPGALSIASAADGSTSLVPVARPGAGNSVASASTTSNALMPGGANNIALTARMLTSVANVRAQMDKVKQARMSVKERVKGGGLEQEMADLGKFRKDIGGGGAGKALKWVKSKEISGILEEARMIPDIATVINSRPCELLISFVILMNAVVMGMQVDAGMRQDGSKSLDVVFRVFDVFFLGFFSLELVLRVSAEKCYYFSLRNDKANWNWFDALLVVSSLLEEILSKLINVQANMSVMRVFRMLRLVRVFRVIRVMRFFRDLRVIASGIASSLQSLVWAGLLLFVLMFLCAVCVLQFAVEEVERREKDPDDGILSDMDYGMLRRYYDSLFNTMYTLYQSITGGLNWREAAQPLMSISIGLGLLYSFYIAFAVLCVLNIITGVFVENANKMTAQDHEMVMMEELETRRKWLEEVKILFEAADADGSGWLSAEEFAEQLKDVKMQAWFRKIGIQVESYSASGLFQLLDFDGDGQLDLDEFAIALQQVHGAAKSIDVAKICHDTRVLRKNVETLSELCFFAFEQLSPGCVETCFENEDEEDDSAEVDKDNTDTVAE